MNENEERTRWCTFFLALLSLVKGPRFFSFLPIFLFCHKMNRIKYNNIRSWWKHRKWDWCLTNCKLYFIHLHYRTDLQTQTWPWMFNTLKINVYKFCISGVTVLWKICINTWISRGVKWLIEVSFLSAGGAL